MITFKKFAMAVMLIAGFQQASADVCKLKVKDAVKRAVINYGEVWVDRDNGEIYKIPEDSNFLTNIVGETKFKGDVSRLCHIIKRSVEAFEGGTVKGAYRDAIFCSDEHDKEDEVVINVDGANNRQEEAKRQFENIIKCGLISAEASKINEKIYDTSIFTANKDWQMPGISADISDLTATDIPVMCAMKRSMHEYFEKLDDVKKDEIKNKIVEKYEYIQPLTLDQCCKLKFNYKINKGEEKLINGFDVAKHLMCKDKILTVDDWKTILENNHIEKNVFNIEHTERQLLLYHLFNMRGNKWRNTDGVEYINGNATIDGRSLLIYTNGAPCFYEDENMIDNAGTCCWNLYRLLAKKNISICVYFSSFVHIEAFSEKSTRENIYGCECFDFLCNDLGLGGYKLVDVQATVFTFLLNKDTYTIGDLRCSKHTKDFINYFEKMFLEKKIREKYKIHTKQKIFSMLDQSRIWCNKYKNVKFHWLNK